MVGMKLNLICTDGMPLGLEGGVDLAAQAVAPATGPVLSEGIGERIVDAINLGLQRLKDKGDYQVIIGRHLSAFWAGQ